MVGFALFFHNFSTWLARPGIYLEDLFVRTEHRRKVHGQALLRELARLFLARAWPATFFLPTRYLDTGEGLVFQWWNRLKTHLPRKKLEIDPIHADTVRLIAQW